MLSPPEYKREMSGGDLVISMVCAMCTRLWPSQKRRRRSRQTYWGFQMCDELGAAYSMSPLDTATHQAVEQHADQAVLQKGAQTTQPFCDV